MRTFVALLLFTFAIEASAQSLADIARRERERQKQAQPRNTGTYTNANAGTAAAVPQPAANAAAASEEPVEKKEESAAKPIGPTDNK